ncbi:unnamed protein product [Acanthoscelides obtectus]|uniref:Uncharacterized protein n=1 Tax=Acanthoscelides obtectus TaxID=200917 RepID=A0A9P0PSY2_ACAOB|nr:unnamed protein product [Acanthoscelides obtectus]CAK1683253.1 hypothetical protein AOBTE_LOCUS34168 [Acanthoscelides obtectus]
MLPGSDRDRNSVTATDQWLPISILPNSDLGRCFMENQVAGTNGDHSSHRERSPVPIYRSSLSGTLASYLRPLGECVR